VGRQYEIDCFSFGWSLLLYMHYDRPRIHGDSLRLRHHRDVTLNWLLFGDAYADLKVASGRPLGNLRCVLDRVRNAQHKDLSCGIDFYFAFDFDEQIPTQWFGFGREECYELRILVGQQFPPVEFVENVTDLNQPLDLGLGHIAPAGCLLSNISEP
jgi:hypothetical protein